MAKKKKRKWKKNKKATITPHKKETTVSTLGTHKYCTSHQVGEVFSANGGKARVMAGNYLSMKMGIKFDRLSPALGIDLDGDGSHYLKDWPVTSNVAAKEMLGDDLVKRQNIPAILAIDWPDREVPSGLNSMWWAKLAAKLSKIEGDIAINCHGGHGRTGTFLVILAHYLGLIPADTCPLKWLRDRYCDEAVETKEQVAYIERMTGRTAQEAGSWEWGASYCAGKKGDADSFDNLTAGGAYDAELNDTEWLRYDPFGGRGEPVLNNAGDVTGWKYTKETV